ncbi:MAG: phospholipase D-like domain-containing protein [Desulfobulbus sp.]|nr:phospholipase D-like domain-containing protein [Desulfobulbus sp.]
MPFFHKSTARLRLTRLLNRIRLRSDIIHFPGNKVELLPHGGDFFPALFAAIDSAVTQVCIEFYIIKADTTGMLFSSAVKRAAVRGVEVTIIYDALGSFDTPESYWADIRRAGVECLPFNPPSFAKIRLLDIRDHRKLVLIDGQTIFLGGLNVGDEYSGYGDSFTRWRDVGIRLDGPAAGELQKIFNATWERLSGQSLRMSVGESVIKQGEADVVIVNGRPHLNRPLIRNAFRIAMSGAEKTIEIITPYFVPGPRVVRSLLRAVRRGVRIQIILPSISDVPVVKIVGRAYLKPLLQAGIEIYERQGTILHAKVMSVDSRWVTLGSANLDLRSFHRNFEINVIIASRLFGSQIEGLFSEELAKSRRVDRQEYDGRGRFERFCEWILAPLGRFL